MTPNFFGILLYVPILLSLLFVPFKDDGLPQKTTELHSFVRVSAFVVAGLAIIGVIMMFLLPM